MLKAMQHVQRKTSELLVGQEKKKQNKTPSKPHRGDDMEMEALKQKPGREGGREEHAILG